MVHGKAFQRNYEWNGIPSHLLRRQSPNVALTKAVSEADYNTA